MIEFRYLPAFLAVAESGSFTAAGKRLFIATSAVSRQVALLEASCGQQLFFRTPQETKLTEAGRRLFDETRRFHVETERAVGSAARLPLSLGTLQGVLHRWLVPIIAREPFFADPRLRIRVAAPEELVGGVESGEMDAAFFSYATQAEVPATLRVIRLFDEDIRLISRRPVELRDIDRHPWVSLARTGWLQRYRGREPERQIVVNDLLAVVELVRQGAGIAMVPAYMVDGQKGLHARPVPKFAGAAICLLTRRYEREPAALSEFLEVVRRHAPAWREERRLSPRSR